MQCDKNLNSNLFIQQQQKKTSFNVTKLAQKLLHNQEKAKFDYFYFTVFYCKSELMNWLSVDQLTFNSYFYSRMRRQDTCEVPIDF